MKEIGAVIKKEQGKAVIEVLPKKECSKCCSCGAFRKRHFILDGKSAEILKQGDAVEIEIAQSAMMKVYFFLYGLPLIVFVGMIFGVYMFTSSPVISFSSALFAVIAAYLIIGRFNRGTFCLTLVSKV